MNLLRSPIAFALTAILLAPAVGLAYPRDDAGVVAVDVLSRDDVHRLVDLGMDILGVREGVVEIAAVPSEVDRLWANGFRPRMLLERMTDAVASLSLPDRGEYHSYTELTNDLAAWAAAYPSITELVSIGQSYEGREVWALKITDNPGIEEAEPEVQWIGCHHGNESISVEVPYYMAERLLTDYGFDPQITWLVDNREIWIVPMLNPDGHTAGSRYNAQGIDLNRNYTCPCGCNAGTAFSAVESALLRDFNVGMNPVTSLTFHSGAVYVNYLWDYTYDPTPDESMIITYSNGYASYTGYPVTNGADWYIAHGTCQDWCYNTRGEIDWTIELSNSYEPPQNSIDGIVDDNIPAMLYLARHSGHGIRGTVTDAASGDPLAATVSVPEAGRDVHTDPGAGDYHRMVEAGSYTVTAFVPGRPPQAAYGVTASPDTFVVVDFEFEEPLFCDDFESGMSAWTGDWSATGEAFCTPSGCATESPGGDYPDGAFAVMTLASPIDLSAQSSASLSFWHTYETESGYDFCRVEVSGDGGAGWQSVASFDGASGSWSRVDIDLDDYAGSALFLVRFVLDADEWAGGDGWHVDDVAVFGDSAGTGVPPESEALRLAVSNYPNPFNPATVVRCAGVDAGPVRLGIYDVAGRLVRTYERAAESGAVVEFGWDGRDASSRPVAAGVYFARVETHGGTAATKMVLLK